MQDQRLESTRVDVLHLRQAQLKRLTRFAAPASVDTHCHVLPGIDDGPATLDEAVLLCEALVNDGVTAVIATSHQLGPFAEVTADAIRRAATVLSAALVERHIPLTVRPGAEIRIEDGIVRRLADGQVLAMPDGGPYVLLELPHETVFEITNLIDALVARGKVPVLAHPERNALLARSPSLLLPWLSRGLLLQVTGGSLTGGFGPRAQQAAWEMLDAGWVTLIATDAHDTINRPPTMTSAIDSLAKQVGHAVARRLCVTNPQAVLEGTPVVRPRGVGRLRGRA
ncbi:MAG: hypothetical protein QM754_00285 [Tepidisphaeraceae bacterium]